MWPHEKLKILVPFVTSFFTQNVPSLSFVFDTTSPPICKTLLYFMRLSTFTFEIFILCELLIIW